MIDPKAYLYYGERCELVDVVYGLASGGKLRLRLQEPDDYQAFGSVTKRAGNRAGQILRVLYRHPGEDEFSEIDGWFAGWTVGHKTGCVVALTLDDEGFDRLRTCERGEIFEVMIYQIEDDGSTYSEEQRTKTEAALKGGPISIQAGKACHDLSFHRFLEQELKIAGITSAAEAATFVRSHCGITTRAALDHDSKARVKWQQLYRKWLATHL